jgi:hypothetical protein
MTDSTSSPPGWKDSEGRFWSTEITPNDNRRVIKLVGVDLFDAFDGQLLTRLSRDPMCLVDTLYAVCKPEADDRNLTAEQFAELLVGDAIEEAAEALVQGLLRFFPRDQRTVLVRVWNGMKRAKQESLQAADSKISVDQVNELVTLSRTKTEREIDRELARIKAELAATESDESSTNSQAPSESIPAG